MELVRNIGVERALLGIILNHNNAIFETGALVAGDFAEVANGELFLLLKDQIEAGRTVTAGTLLHDAQDAIVWGELKASEYLLKLEGDAPGDPHLVSELARTIRDTALRQRLVEFFDEWRPRIIASPVSVPAVKLREEVEAAMAALFGSVSDLGLQRFYEIGEGILGRLKESTSPLGLSVGLKGVQDLTGALLGGRLYMIGGAPGSGKSALISHIAKAVAAQGKTGSIYSPEMGGEEIVSRSLSGDTGIPSEVIDRSLVNNAEFEELWRANEAYKGLEFFVDQSSKPSVAMIRGRSLNKKRMGGLDIVLIDHVHYLAKADRKMSEHDALDENLEMLKAMAKDLDIPVVIACQYGTDALRDMAKWPHRRPHQGDLLYAGIVERHADVILLLHRREYFLLRNEPGKDEKHWGEWGAACLDAQGKAEVILTKRRGGKGSGIKTLHFDAGRVTFSDNLPISRRDETALPFDYGAR